MSKILLINPSYYQEIFAHSKVRAAISRGTPCLGLLTVAAPLLNSSHKVKLLDLNLSENPSLNLDNELKDFEPDYVAMSATTPLITSVCQIAEKVKRINSKTVVVVGGPHPSALPKETLEKSVIDYVVCGEGDYVLDGIVNKGFSSLIPNIFYKDGRVISSSAAERKIVEDMDTLPFPAYELLDVKKYKQPEISSRSSPVGYLETSRGCHGACVFCNKNIYGYKFRPKSPIRVVDEMVRMLRMGFNEIHIIDDAFMTDPERVCSICDEISRRGLNFPWYPRGGVRVDAVNKEAFKMMKRAGCYRVPFGVESGSQRILDQVGKKITLEQAEIAVMMAKEVGFETECYFMIGHPRESEADILKSIEFAIKLNPDYAKFAIVIPLPGTPLFSKMKKNNQIKTFNWDKYNFSTPPKEIYTHDSLSWEIIEKYYTKSHRRFYLRLNYIMSMLYKTARKGNFTGHVKAFFKTDW